MEIYFAYGDWRYPTIEDDTPIDMKMKANPITKETE